MDLVRAGAIPSGDLKPPQARILAALLTSQPATPEQILHALTAAPGGGSAGVGEGSRNRT
ncbi:hypothetical protein OL239_17445 [Arthrobacter sp. ATA002]|uniref:hypothetical protein n=1 Tax=Arthrobacter sp. ATA002 TaxID=2991715 RepID=UPI0022A76913|nr:hypothetical protein [Arthrobacter sp. ATA002]WAP51547.1 hypothetical protein OL239_17445 [Arthrobacter sp. ATA002]